MAAVDIIISKITLFKVIVPVHLFPAADAGRKQIIA
jgi:hypothetical protein